MPESQLTPARRAARRRRVERRRRRAVATVTATLSACIMIVAGAVMTANANARDADPQASGSAPAEVVAETPEPTATPTPTPTPTASDTPDDAEPFCTDEVTAAIDSGDAEAVVVAAGGGQAFRDAVVDGRADDCISLGHPAWDWVVVNKQRPLDPIDYAPEVVVPQTFSPIGAHLDEAAAQALDALVVGARDAGAGEIGLESGYRSYETQVESYNAQVVLRGGTDGADRTSARPGYSEHQLGLAADLVACEGQQCGTIYEFGDTVQGAWVAENAWRYGWIVRYESGTTDITGYEPEPWHLRYVGVELATAYTEGGYSTYEEFWELPAAPGYE